MLRAVRTSRSWVALMSVAVVGAAAAYMVSCGTDDSEPVAHKTVALASNPTSGAIFTTLPDGTSVNHNIYQAKEDVYLDGGPGPNAPAKAAGLPEGDYYFQVTDPSGKDLLSTDHISCRRVSVNEHGVIEHVYEGTNYQWQGGWVAVPCQHQQGIDIDHPELGAITVQLMPFDDTKNPGGVYKAWMIPVDEYAGDPNFVPTHRKDAVNGESYQPGNVHGFIHSASKTDNFKVKGKKSCEPPVVIVKKFHDMNVNGVMDAGEPFVAGWMVGVADPSGGTNTIYTPEEVLADPGVWAFTEAVPDGVLQTAAYLDGVALSVQATVMVDVDSACGGETHEVLFGNVAVGDAVVCKVYDRDGSGTGDEGEPLVPGWKMVLTGTAVTGAEVSLTELTDATGCATFAGLLPGSYTVAEVMPAGGSWMATGELSQSFTIESMMGEGSLACPPVDIEFTNLCTGLADFDTKGYWHNKNGLAEMTEADIVFANGLAPYAQPSSYFDAGDEPFDGLFAGGEAVASAFNNSGEYLAPAGTAKAEVSLFLVDANAGGDPREQLAQQLLAFVFNIRHNLDSPDAAIVLPDGELMSGTAIVDEAVEVWLGDNAWLHGAVAQILDQLNNDDALPVVMWMPCEVTYP